MYLAKISTERKNLYFDYLVDPSFRGVNKLFVCFLLENLFNREAHTGYYLPNVDIKDYNILINQ